MAERMDFNTAFERLLGVEGGFVDDPRDSGGATRYGITERVARANGYDGDMRALPLDLAKTIAREEYWDVLSLDELPKAIRFDLFDAAYNSGPAQAAKFLQRAAGTVPDGAIGPKTIAAAKTINAYRLLARFNGQRLDFLNDRKNWDDFSEGWAQRVAENLMKA